MKKLLFLFFLFSAPVFAENIDKSLVEEKRSVMSEKLRNKIKERPLLEDDEFLRLTGYLEALDFVISIID